MSAAGPRRRSMRSPRRRSTPAVGRTARRRFHSTRCIGQAQSSTSPSLRGSPTITRATPRRTSPVCAPRATPRPCAPWKRAFRAASRACLPNRASTRNIAGGARLLRCPAIDRHTPAPARPSTRSEAKMNKFVLLLVTLLFSAFALAAVNINTASKEELDALPEIGPVKAQAIVDYRAKNGPFKTPEDVMKVNGIKEGTFAKIKGMISVSGASTPVAAPAAKAETKTATPPAMQPAPAAKSAAPATAATPATPAAPATKNAPAMQSTTPTAGAGSAKGAAGGAAPSGSSAKDAKTLKAENAAADKAAKAKAKADAAAEA